MSKKQVITRAFIIERINDLLTSKITRRSFGEEMFAYLAFDDKNELEKGSESILEIILGKFTEMHDLDRGNVGYNPELYCPTQRQMQYLCDCLKGTIVFSENQYNNLKN